MKTDICFIYLPFLFWQRNWLDVCLMKGVLRIAVPSMAFVTVVLVFAFATCACVITEGYQQSEPVFIENTTTTVRAQLERQL
jgi:hypothetical protein